jgi:hypothetical protein
MSRYAELSLSYFQQPENMIFAVYSTWAERHGIKRLWVRIPLVPLTYPLPIQGFAESHFIVILAVKCWTTLMIALRHGMQTVPSGSFFS